LSAGELDRSAAYFGVIPFMDDVSFIDTALSFLGFGFSNHPRYGNAVPVPPRNNECILP
jgi:hypothetical protein